MKKIVILLICFQTILLSPAWSQSLTDSLVIHIPLNGNADDSTTNGNDGSVYGATSTTDRFGTTNAAYSFDGSDDYIKISPSSDLSKVEDFALSIWFYPTGWHPQSGLPSGISDQQYIFDGHAYSSTASSNLLRDGINVVAYLKTNSEYFTRHTTFNLTGNTYYFDFYSPSDYLNVWHHSVVVRKDQKTYHYFDGDLQQVQYNDGKALDMDHDLYLGTFSGNNKTYSVNYNFKGKMDDFRYYNRALEEKEIKYLYYGYCNKDSMTFYDTTNVTIYDTTFVTVYDTTDVTIYDTSHVIINDTNVIDVYDTTRIVIYDTNFVTVPIYDTTHIVQYDTVTTRDTFYVAVTDTLYIKLNRNTTPSSTCEVRVYPNPTDNMLYIDTEQACTLKGYQVKIVDDIGQLVFQTTISKTTHSMDLSKFVANGIYIIEISSPTGVVLKTKKIIIY
ncbi:MAG: hypothetical protein ACI9UJ_001196 [bacterium]|jgi:hypothetical protein